MAHIPKDDLYGQYASDKVLLGLQSDSLSQIGADSRGDGTIGFHNIGLFDETAVLPDEATGLIPEESNDLETIEGLNVVPDKVVFSGLKEVTKKSKEDLLTEKWMKDNGYTF